MASNMRFIALARKARSLSREGGDFQFEVCWSNSHGPYTGSRVARRLSSMISHAFILPTAFNKRVQRVGEVKASCNATLS